MYNKYTLCTALTKYMHQGADDREFSQITALVYVLYIWRRCVLTFENVLQLCQGLSPQGDVAVHVGGILNIGALAAGI
jgi:hypothetical protein